MLWLVVGLSLLVYERESMGSGFLSQSKQIRVILIMKSGGWATTRASFYCIQKTKGGCPLLFTQSAFVSNHCVSE
jgi:hypothetical protein